MTGSADQSTSSQTSDPHSYSCWPTLCPEKVNIGQFPAFSHPQPRLTGELEAGQKYTCHQLGERLDRLSDYSSEVWIYTLQTSLEVHRNMFTHKPRATMGLIFFTVLIQKSPGFFEKFPSGIPLGHQTTFVKFLGQIFPDNTADFPLFIPD